MGLLDYFGNLGPAASGLLGTSADDPKSAANLALAAGMIRGDFGGGILGYNEAMQQGADRAYKKKFGDQQLEKGSLELQQMREVALRQKAIRDELAKMELGGQTNPMTARAGNQIPGPAPVQPPGSGGLLGTDETNAPPSMPGGNGVRAPAGPYPSGGPSMPPVRAPAGPYSAPSMPSDLPQTGGASPVAGSFNSPRGNFTEGLTDRLIKQASIYSRNGEYEAANKLYEQAAKFMPQVDKIEVAMHPQTGRPVNLITYKNGTQQVSEFAPAPKTHYADTGASIDAIDEYTGKTTRSLPKSMTPGERASNAIAGGNLAVARERLAMEQNAPQYMQTDQGIVALPKKPGTGPITGTVVTGPDGATLGPQLKAIPPSANTAIMTNLQNLSRAQNALDLLQGKKVGGASGDPEATGWKGVLPGPVLNRMDPSGVDTRAAIADLGSLVLHERSGAAVTASESPRLAPFIPSATDDAKTAAKKLSRFIDVYRQETNALNETYSKEQGYKPNPALQRNATGPGYAGNRSEPQAMALPPNPTASSLTKGQSYTLPNGETAVWDGMRFKGR